MKTDISVIIPAYNESEKIVNVVQNVKKNLDDTKKQYEMIVVNDGSTDNTGEKIRELDIKVIEHEKNLGYGRSIKDGIRHASGEFILLTDADGTYEIDKIKEMIALAEKADLVIGKRIFYKKDNRSFKWLMREYFKNHTNYYSGDNIEDLNSGQRIFRRCDIIDDLDRYPDKFSFTSTMTVFYTMRRKKVFYTPVAYHQRDLQSKFKSHLNFYSIMKLAIKLTCMAKPLKFSLQMSLVFLVSLIMTGITGSLLGMTFIFKLLSFIILYCLSFLIFLYYINAKGSKIV